MGAIKESVSSAMKAPRQADKPPGKKLSEIEKAKNDATGKASDVGRQLAFAGIATIWLLRNEHGAKPFDSTLSVALLLLGVALLVDFLQYVYCSWVWRGFYNKHYDEHNCDDALVDIPEGLSGSTYFFFWTKIGVLLIGYIFLLISAVGKLQLL